MGATSFLSRTDGNSYGMSHVSTRDMGCPQWTRDVEGKPGHEWNYGGIKISPSCNAVQSASN